MELSPKLVFVFLLLAFFAIGAGNLALSKVSELKDSQSPAPRFFVLGVMAGVLCSLVVTILVNVGENIQVLSRTSLALGVVLAVLFLLLHYIS